MLAGGAVYFLTITTPFGTRYWMNPEKYIADSSMRNLNEREDRSATFLDIHALDQQSEN
jgi:hypothetical protein